MTLKDDKFRQLSDPRPVRTIFVTGTGTGVGKTVLTALLLAYLRSTRNSALALKPFCSGSRGDALLLQSLQDAEPGLDEINPFYFPQPLAPFVAACFGRGKRRAIRSPGPNNNERNLPPSLTNVVAWLQSIYQRHRHEYVLIEGSGGVLVPLGEKFSVLDMISAVADAVIVVASNVLGTLNHSLLTVKTLQQAGLKRISVVLMDCKKPDLSSSTNPAVLSELLAPVPVHSLPFLGPRCRTAAQINAHATRLGPALEDIVRALEVPKKPSRRGDLRVL